jgi:hypothetical protein
MLGKCWNQIIMGALLLILFNAAAVKSGSDDSTLTEYEVKGAYIYYFAKFIEWPVDALPANSPVVIGIIGDDEFGSLLKSIVKDKTVQDHPISISLLKWPADLHTCHIVYISSPEKKRFSQIAESLKKHPALTVTEFEAGSQPKGIINLFVEDGKVQFETDAFSAAKANLQINSKLLRLARQVAGIQQVKERSNETIHREPSLK